MRSGSMTASTPARSARRLMSTETCASPTAEMMVWCVSSLRLTDMVGSASQAFSRKVLSLSSSLRLTARMATW